MNKLKLNKNGFSAVESLMLLVIIILIGIIGYFVYLRSHHSLHAIKAVSSPAKVITWKTYSNPTIGITYKYPSNWINTVTEESLLYGSFVGYRGTITAPNNTKLSWIAQVVGGGGGADISCPSTDVPFKFGDTCNSKQIYSVQQLPALNPSSNQYSNIFMNGLYITETKFNPGKNVMPPTYKGTPSYPANTNSYQICLDPHYSVSNGGAIPTVGVKMGYLVMPCSYWKTGFNAMYPVKNKVAFNSVDAQTAIKIMKTFNTIN